MVTEMLGKTLGFLFDLLDKFTCRSQDEPIWPVKCCTIIKSG